MARKCLVWRVARRQVSVRQLTICGTKNCAQRSGGTTVVRASMDDRGERGGDRGTVRRIFWDGENATMSVRDVMDVEVLRWICV